MKASILMVEDNEQNQYLAKFLLEYYGYKVTVAVDGPSGLALANNHQFDLILMDIQLPGMDGYAVAKALRGTALYKSVPIVAVTSYAMTGDRENVLAAGFNGYIDKPINPESFVLDVASFLKQGQEFIND